MEHAIDDLPIELLDGIMQWVTPMDRMVCAHVSHCWRAIVMAAEAAGRAKQRPPADRPEADFIADAVRAGHWNQVEWARGQGCAWSERAPLAAIEARRADLFERLVSLNCPLSTSACATAAAKCGDIKSLEWILAAGCLGREDAQSALAAAAKYGHLNALDLLCAYDYACGDKSCWARRLVAKPHADTPLSNCCVCAQHVARKAARGGHNHVLAWLRDYDCPRDYNCSATAMTNYAAFGGHIETVQWLYERGTPMKPSACQWAADAGRLDTLEWLRANDWPWDGTTCLHAAHKGHMEVLQWAVANGCPLDYLTTTFAVIGGHPDVAEWALAQGCALVTANDHRSFYHSSLLAIMIYDDSAMDIVASKGRVDLVEWLHAHGCEANTNTFIRAAENGHLATLDWLNDNCIPWNEEICAQVAARGLLRVLQHLRQQGCPWDQQTCVAAATRGHLEMLQWARANGCPWDRQACLVEARRCGHRSTLAWIESHPV
jgi:hypothetical protein